ncbi:MAG: DUF4136 domain-containing protein [Sphingomonadales bacterium]
MRMLKLSLAMAATLALGACASAFKSDVAHFHQLQGVSSGATFEIVPKDEELTGGLEFAQYANLVRSKLIQQGYQPASSADGADLIVTLDYGVSEPTQKIRTLGGGVGGDGVGGAGFGNPFFFGPVFGPGFGGGFGPDVYSYEVYSRGLSLSIEKPATANSAREVVFEGSVESNGRDNNLPEVMPFLVEAMFTDFPGTSGVTREVKIKDLGAQ